MFNRYWNSSESITMVIYEYIKAISDDLTIVTIAKYSVSDLLLSLSTRVRLNYCN